jgi:hypothetical protein
MCLSHSHTHGVGKTLAQRPSGHFNAGGVVNLWVARGLGAKDAKSEQVIPTELISREVQHGVLKDGRVAWRQDEAITIGPSWVTGIEVHDARKQHMR